jgi:hypothetical protein
MDASLSSEMEMVPDFITSESQEAVKFVTSAMLELSTDSKMEVAPESEMEVVPDSMMPDYKMELAPESEMVPKCLPPGAFICGRCHLVHEDREAWNRVHSRFWPCSRCHLKHADYIFFAMRRGFIEFDCKLFIPNLDNVVFDGNTLVLPPHVLKMIDEKRERELATKKDHAKASVR